MVDAVRTVYFACSAQAMIEGDIGQREMWTGVIASLVRKRFIHVLSGSRVHILGGICTVGGETTLNFLVSKFAQPNYPHSKEIEHLCPIAAVLGFAR